MGLFSFIKDMGEKLGIVDKEEAPSAEALTAELDSHGLEAEGLDVTVEGDKVKVAGTAESNSVCEKIILSLGNVLGISEVEEEIAVNSEEPDAVFYTVVKGDTLWKISDEHYGNGSKYNTIFEANKPMLKHPGKIYPGPVLRIPPLESA